MRACYGPVLVRFVCKIELHEQDHRDVIFRTPRGVQSTNLRAAAGLPRRSFPEISPSCDGHDFCMVSWPL